MTHEDLKDYLIYLKEVERCAMQKLEMLMKVRLEQKVQIEQEKRENEEKALREKEKARHERVQILIQRLEMLEKARQVEELKRE